MLMRKPSTIISLLLVIILGVSIHLATLNKQIEEYRHDIIKLEIEYQRLEHKSQWYQEQLFIAQTESYAAYDEARQIAMIEEATYYLTK